MVTTLDAIGARPLAHVQHSYTKSMSPRWRPTTSACATSRRSVRQRSTILPAWHGDTLDWATSSVVARLVSRAGGGKMQPMSRPLGREPSEGSVRRRSAMRQGGMPDEPDGGPSAGQPSASDPSSGDAGDRASAAQLRSGGRRHGAWIGRASHFPPIFCVCARHLRSGHAVRCRRAPSRSVRTLVRSQVLVSSARWQRTRGSDAERDADDSAKAALFQVDPQM